MRAVAIVVADLRQQALELLHVAGCRIAELRIGAIAAPNLVERLLTGLGIEAARDSAVSPRRHRSHISTAAALSMKPEISRLSASSVSAPLDAASSGSSREAAASRFESHPGCPRSAADAGGEAAGVATVRGAAVDDVGHDCVWTARGGWAQLQGAGPPLTPDSRLRRSETASRDARQTRFRAAT